MTIDVQGRVAVITGGGGGLGTALAKVFAGAGMAVATLDIDEGNARASAEQIAAEYGVATTAFRTDVGDTDSVAAAARHVASSLGRCDVLCANVGVQQFGAIESLTEQDWQWVTNVNVLGTARTVREFLPLLRATEGWRRIVLTASSSVLAPSIRLGVYQTSKYAVMGFGETLREELAPEGIGVTVLFPGGMLTRHLESSVDARPAALGSRALDPSDVEAMLTHTPMDERDLVTPERAVRNLLADLMADEPFSITHGSFRSAWERRRDAIDAAFDRMQQ